MTQPIDAVFEAVATTAEDVRSILGERRSYEAEENPSGEQQLAADVYADELLEERLLAIDSIRSYASEEREEVVEAADGDAVERAGKKVGEKTGEYHVVCDPLDGSSNLKSNNGMGTIVGIYDRPLPAPGNALVGAGYVLYGPITTMVTAAEGTVDEYIVENGELSPLNRDLSLPEDPVVYGFGGLVPEWIPDFHEYVAAIEADQLKLRYGGAMVADVNQVMTYGGIFGYPMLQSRPEGKLRLQFEGHPMAYVIETAGGASSNGEQSLLELEPQELHQRSPVFVGNEGLIRRFEQTLG